MIIYELCVEQEYAEPCTVKLFRYKENAEHALKEWQEEYGDEVFINESKTED